MKLSTVRRRIRSASMKQIERLEDRCLLSATLASNVPTQNLVTASGETAQVNLSTFLNDPSLSGGTVIEMQTPLGNIPFQLTDAQTPLTVANFVAYINSGEYSPTMIQRLAAGFVLQGGGTAPDGSTNSPIGTLNSSGGTVTAEAHFSNTAGTIAMALSDGPDSATNQWFINLGSNTALDGTGDGGPFTVFGGVIDGGGTVINAIAHLTTIDGGAENSNWAVPAGTATLPVLPGYSGPTTLVAGTPIPPSDLVTDNVVIIPSGQALTYSAVSANPAVVTASVTNGVLTLSAAPGVTSGAAMVTATVTDLSGQTASSTFAVGVNQVITTVSSSLVGSPSTTIATTPLKLKEKLVLAANNGAAKGNASATVQLSPDETAASSVFTLATKTSSVHLKAGKQKSVNLKVARTIPSTVLAGTYHVLVTTTDTVGTVVTTDSGQTITVVAPVVDITGSVVDSKPVTIGKKTTLTISITNSSAATVAAIGTLPFDVDTSPDGLLSDASPLLNGMKHIHLKPGKTVKINLHVTLSALTPIVVSLDPGNVVFANDVDLANNAFSTQLIARQ